MDEVNIWSVDGDSNVAPLPKKGQTDTEELLEETLVKNPGMLLPGLRLVGRQTPTEGGPLDLLGVDEDGRLVVFELKRGTLSRDAVAQIIDYASDLDSKSDVELAEHIADNSGVGGIEKIDDLEEWYAQNSGAEGLESLRPMRMFLIGLGADDRTERMVRFLAENSRMDISLLTFHGFAYNGKTLLAKQVEVVGNTSSPSTRLSREERWDVLLGRAEGSGISEMFDEVKGMFEDSWPESRQFPAKTGFSVKMRPSAGSRRRNYARVFPGQGRVRICFERRAFELCKDEFVQPLDEIPYETWPRNRKPLEDVDTQSVEFLPTAAEWKTHKGRLSALTQAVYEAWESSDQVEDTV